jgi:NAD(P)-dependent dehydrogenase (short-subunit alcohol dehydrogenase family)
MGKLDGKVALITGGGLGIGREIATLFAKEGAKVMVADYAPESGEETVSMMKKAGGDASFVKADVSKIADVENMVKATVDTYGKLDILINNAGVMQSMVPTHETPDDEWERVININLKGVFLGIKYAVPVMLKGGGGVIVNAASVAGLVGFGNSAAYCASKGGVVQLTKVAALDYATQNIRVNCICPGVIWTPMVKAITGDNEQAIAQFTAMEPVGRMGKPEEVAQAYLFLASDDASFVTGVALPVDGAFVAQ